MARGAAQGDQVLYRMFSITPLSPCKSSWLQQAHSRNQLRNSRLLLLKTHPMTL